MFKKCILSASIAAVLTLGMSGFALAQTTDTDQDKEDDNVLEEVIVTGVRYSMTEAVEVKRNTMQIVDAIVAEDLGKFPDNNVVEAMQRIPGVQTTNRGAGEVSTVQIRGLADVTTTVNGRNIFTASGRSVALADIPATLVNRVDVYKTRSPNQIARGIAGQIDIHTNRPFDFDGFKVLAQGRAIYQEERGKTDPNLAFLISDRWDTDAGEFGALFNASYAQTNFRDQGAHAGADVPFRLPTDPVAPLERLFPPLWTPGLDNGLPTAPGSTLDLAPDIPYVLSRDAVFSSDFTGKRKRPAWNLSLQWAPNDRSEYTFEAFYNGYRNTTYNSLWFQFVDAWWAVDPNDPVELYPDTNVVHSRYVRGDPFSFTSGDYTDQSTDSYMYALRGDWDFTDNLKVNSELYYQDSKFKTDFFAVRMARTYPALFVNFNQGNGIPSVDYLAGDPTNPDEYWLDWAYDNGGRNSGDAWTWTGDADYTVDWGWFNTVSFGARYDKRGAKERNRGVSGGPLPGYGLGDFPGLATVTTGFFGKAGDIVHAWAVPSDAYIIDHTDELRAAYGFPSVDGSSYDLNFKIDETQWAGYLQADFSKELGNGGFIDGRVGVRYLDVSTDMTVPDPDNPGSFIKGNNKNDTWLPSIMLRWGITENLMARFSYTETFNLPTFTQLSPYINWVPDVTDIGYGTAAGGNQDLQPTESKNYDISLEWYFTEGSVLYATWFKRDLSGMIVDFRRPVVYDVPDDQPDLGPYTFILSQPANAGNGTLDGWEFGFTWFPELPGWFDGLGFQGSYTLLNSQQEYPILDEVGDQIGTQVLPFLGVSDNSYSAILAYDRDTFSARLSYFWREAFHDRQEAALFANPLAIWKSPEKSLDFQATWSISDRWQLTFDATNITQEIYHENYGDQPVVFNFHNNFYSRTFALGLRFEM